jgi:hypothetical protein
MISADRPGTAFNCYSGISLKRDRARLSARR